MMRLYRNFLSDEEGTTMTEFVMTIPMFIVSFVAVIQLGSMNELSVKTWSTAHARTFRAAIPSSHMRFSPFAVPAVGAAAGFGTLAQAPPQSTTGIQRAFYIGSDTATYGGMALRGHWGESYWRTRPADLIVDFQFIEDNASMNPQDIIGGSEYTRDLVDEQVGNYSGSGGGALAALNSFVSASGLRPAIAAGMRYGAVAGWANKDRTVLGLTVDTGAGFTTLVPPYPLRDAEAEFLPTGVTRLTMESYDPYAEILGVELMPNYLLAILGSSSSPPPDFGFPL